MKNYLIFAIIILSAFTACDKDQISYEYNKNYNVRVNIDWTTANIHPNGASVYIYNMDGTLYRQESPFSDPSSGTIQLPKGDYKMIVFSDTPEEYSDYLTFDGLNNWYTATAKTIYDEERSAKAKEQMAKAAAAKEAATKESGAKGAIGINVEYTEIGEYVKTPDTLGVAKIDSFHVGGTDVEYYTTESDGSNVVKTNDYDDKVSMTTKRVIRDFQFKVHVKGLCYAKRQTETDLVGVSKGYYLGVGSNMDERVTHTFILNNRKYDEESSKDGTITGTQLSFGLLPGTDNRYYLVIHFVLVDETDYPVTVDITDMITESEDLYLNLDLELPYAEDVTSAVRVGGWSEESQDVSM